MSAESAGEDRGYESLERHKPAEEVMRLFSAASDHFKKLVMIRVGFTLVTMRVIDSFYGNERSDLDRIRKRRSVLLDWKIWTRFYPTERDEQPSEGFRAILAELQKDNEVTNILMDYFDALILMIGEAVKDNFELMDPLSRTPPSEDHCMLVIMNNLFNMGNFLGEKNRAPRLPGGAESLILDKEDYVKRRLKGLYEEFMTQDDEHDDVVFSLSDRFSAREHQARRAAARMNTPLRVGDAASYPLLVSRISKVFAVCRRVIDTACAHLYMLPSLYTRSQCERTFVERFSKEFTKDGSDYDLDAAFLRDQGHYYTLFSQIRCMGMAYLRRAIAFTLDINFEAVRYHRELELSSFGPETGKGIASLLVNYKSRTDSLTQDAVGVAFSEEAEAKHLVDVISSSSAAHHLIPSACTFGKVLGFKYDLAKLMTDVIKLYGGTLKRIVHAVAGRPIEDSLPQSDYDRYLGEDFRYLFSEEFTGHVAGAVTDVAQAGRGIGYATTTPTKPKRNYYPYKIIPGWASTAIYANAVYEAYDGEVMILTLKSSKQDDQVVPGVFNYRAIAAPTVTTQYSSEVLLRHLLNQHVHLPRVQEAFDYLMLYRLRMMKSLLDPNDILNLAMYELHKNAHNERSGPYRSTLTPLGYYRNVTHYYPETLSGLPVNKIAASKETSDFFWLATAAVPVLYHLEPRSLVQVADAYPALAHYTHRIETCWLTECLLELLSSEDYNVTTADLAVPPVSMDIETDFSKQMAKLAHARGGSGKALPAGREYDAHMDNVVLAVENLSTNTLALIKWLQRAKQTLWFDQALRASSQSLLSPATPPRLTGLLASRNVLAPLDVSTSSSSSSSAAPAESTGSVTLCEVPEKTGEQTFARYLQSQIDYMTDEERFLLGIYFLLSFSLREPLALYRDYDVASMLVYLSRTLRSNALSTMLTAEHDVAMTMDNPLQRHLLAPNFNAIHDMVRQKHLQLFAHLNDKMKDATMTNDVSLLARLGSGIFTSGALPASYHGPSLVSPGLRSRMRRYISLFVSMSSYTQRLHGVRSQNPVVKMPSEFANSLEEHRFFQVGGFRGYPMSDAEIDSLLDELLAVVQWMISHHYRAFKEYTRDSVSDKEAIERAAMLVWDARGKGTRVLVRKAFLLACRSNPRGIDTFTRNAMDGNSFTMPTTLGDIKYKCASRILHKTIEIHDKLRPGAYEQWVKVGSPGRLLGNVEYTNNNYYDYLFSMAFILQGTPFITDAQVADLNKVIYIIMANARAYQNERQKAVRSDETMTAHLRPIEKYMDRAIHAIREDRKYDAADAVEEKYVSLMGMPHDKLGMANLLAARDSSSGDGVREENLEFVTTGEMFAISEAVVDNIVDAMHSYSATKTYAYRGSKQLEPWHVEFLTNGVIPGSHKYSDVSVMHLFLWLARDNDIANPRSFKALFYKRYLRNMEEFFDRSMYKSKYKQWVPSREKRIVDYSSLLSSLRSASHVLYLIVDHIKETEKKEEVSVQELFAPLNSALAHGSESVFQDIIREATTNLPPGEELRFNESMHSQDIPQDLYHQKYDSKTVLDSRDYNTRFSLFYKTFDAPGPSETGYELVINLSENKKDSLGLIVDNTELGIVRDIPLTGGILVGNVIDPARRLIRASITLLYKARTKGKGAKEQQPSAMCSLTLAPMNVILGGTPVRIDCMSVANRKGMMTRAADLEYLLEHGRESKSYKNSKMIFTPETIETRVESANQLELAMVHLHAVKASMDLSKEKRKKRLSFRASVGAKDKPLRIHHRADETRWFLGLLKVNSDLKDPIYEVAIARTTNTSAVLRRALSMHLVSACSLESGIRKTCKVAERMREYSIEAPPEFAPPYYELNVSNNRHANAPTFNFSVFYLANCLLVPPVITSTKTHSAYTLLKKKAGESSPLDAGVIAPGYQLAIEAVPKCTPHSTLLPHRLTPSQLEAVIEKNHRAYKMFLSRRPAGEGKGHYHMHPLGKCTRMTQGANPILTAGTLNVSEYEMILDEEIYRDVNAADVFGNCILESVKRARTNDSVQVGVFEYYSDMHTSRPYPIGNGPGISYFSTIGVKHRATKEEMLLSLGLSFVDYTKHLSQGKQFLAREYKGSNAYWRPAVFDTFLHASLSFFLGLFDVRTRDVALLKTGRRDKFLIGGHDDPTLRMEINGHVAEVSENASPDPAIGFVRPIILQLEPPAEDNENQYTVSSLYMYNLVNWLTERSRLVYLEGMYTLHMCYLAFLIDFHKVHHDFELAPSDYRKARFFSTERVTLRAVGPSAYAEHSSTNISFVTSAIQE